MDGKKFKFVLLFLMFFQSCCLLAEPEVVKISNSTKNEVSASRVFEVKTTCISKISQPIIFWAKSFIEKRKRGEFFEVPFISIAGCSAVGKTEFAKGLKIELEKEKIEVEILKQDDFIMPNKAGCGNFAHPWLNHKEMHRVINDIKNGQLHISRPRYDWVSRTVTYETLDLTKVDIILFEGLYVLNSDSPYDFNRYANIHIFIDAAEEDIIKWDWQREKDSANSCYIPMSKKKFNKTVVRNMRDYHKNIFPNKKKADFIIEKDKNHNYSLIVTRLITQ